MDRGDSVPEQTGRPAEAGARILDTHVHVWDPARLDYPWLASVPALDRPFLPEDIDRAGGRTTRMVFVEADCRSDLHLDEARFVEAAAWPELAGIVAGADLRSETLGAHLDALRATGRVVGIRQSLQSEPSDVFADARMAAGLALLAGRGLTFDACVRHAQLPALADLLERSPETTVVLDHLGKPPVDAGLASAEGRAWADAIERIAARGNTAVKLSGLAAEASGAAAFERHADAFIARALEAFGPQRAMLGSDWPVSRILGAAVPFADWIARVERVAALDPDAWTAVASGTGARVYGLG